MFITWQSAQHSLPGGHYMTETITAGSGYQIVSAGFQNAGNASDLYASQIFVSGNGAQAYFQLVNTSLTSTDVWYWVALAAPSSADVSATPPVTENNTVTTK